MRAISLSCPQIVHYRAICWVLVLSASSLGVADTIYLKNGKKIVADSVREEADKVVYETGGGEFTIPDALVDHINKTPPADEVPPEDTPAQDTSVRRSPSRHGDRVDSGAQGHSPVIERGVVNEAYLQALDHELNNKPESRPALSQAYREAANFLVAKGEPEAGIEKYRHALSLLPDDLGLTIGLSDLLVKQNRPWEAIELLLPAADRNSNSHPVHVLLGSAFYAMEDLDQAVSEWNKALALNPTPDVREALDKAERERAAAASYQDLRSQHFLLRYDESAVKALANEMLRALEDLFGQIQTDLDVYPQDTITVLLYPKQAFRDVTRSPAWAGALNDGKIRVPVSGVSSMTIELTRMLKHELTHSFVRQITLGRCPQWFNEGLAQLEEGSTTLGVGKEIARAFGGGEAPAYSALEGSFIGLSQESAKLTYLKSLAALEYLRDTYGMIEIRQMLKLMAATPDFGSVLQKELQVTYSDFEKAVADYVADRSGRS